VTTGSTATLTPRTTPVLGVGAVADHPTRIGLDRIDARAAMLARAGRGDYWRWLAHVQTAAACTRPVRLAGTVHTVNTATGELLDSRATADMPDAVIYKSCGNRRASACPACAEVYRADAYQLVLAGLRGGKGIPDTVAGHPAVFATLTAPSFGLVHSQRRRHPTAGARPCRPRRIPERCPHGRDLTCRRTHADDDPVLGKPLCPDCYDYTGQVVWNAHASELWRRTTIAISRTLTRHARSHAGRVRLSFGKAAEYQRRGVVHYHALIRLDGLDPDDKERVIPPPEWASVFVLAHAVTEAIGHTAFTTAPHAEQPAGWTIGWGDPGKAADVRPVRAAADHPITREAVAAYLAKYATKSTEATGHVSARITADTVPVYADTTHPGRLIAAAWRLGADPDHRGLRRWAHALGYGGHFFTKSRRYTGTFTRERARRIAWRRNRATASRLERAGAVDLADQHTAQTTDVLTELAFVGIGWHTTADAVLANTAAAMARQKRLTARDVARTA
jgi:replication initiator protein RepSA